MKYINQFYLKIYDLLSRDNKIKQNISNIYINIAKDNPYPFLLINIFQIEDLTKFEFFTYRVKFIISLFNKGKNISFFTDMGNHIKALIKTDIVLLEEYNILSINSNLINFELGQDLLTLKMNMSFEALIQQIDNNNEFS